MKRSQGLINQGTRPAPQLDPFGLLAEADGALASGNRDRAIALITQAYLAFDLAADWERLWSLESPPDGV